MFYKARCLQCFNKTNKAIVFSIKFWLETVSTVTVVWKDLRLQLQEFDIFYYVCFNRMFLSHQFSLFAGIATSTLLNSGPQRT